ncbi:unnamed protein product [Amoebophrya sp. A25]|nr:unnamed protein product [Amoebophrya sp. A25]|eukprot:GSA25T00001611001.1
MPDGGSSVAGTTPVLCQDEEVDRGPRVAKRTWAATSHFGPVVKQCLDQVLSYQPEDCLSAITKELAAFSSTSLRQWEDFEPAGTTSEVQPSSTSAESEGEEQQPPALAEDFAKIRPVISIRGYPVVAEDPLELPFAECPKIPEAPAEEAEPPGDAGAEDDEGPSVEKMLGPMVEIGVAKEAPEGFGGGGFSAFTKTSATSFAGGRSVAGMLTSKGMTATSSSASAFSAQLQQQPVSVPLKDLDEAKVTARFRQNCAQVLIQIVESLGHLECDSTSQTDDILSEIADLEAERVAGVIETTGKAIEDLKRALRTGKPAAGSADPDAGSAGASSPEHSAAEQSAGEQSPRGSDASQDQEEPFDASNAFADAVPVFTRDELKKLEWTLLELARKYADQSGYPATDVLRKEGVRVNALRPVAAKALPFLSIPPSTTFAGGASSLQQPLSSASSSSATYFSGVASSSCASTEIDLATTVAGADCNTGIPHGGAAMAGMPRSPSRAASSKGGTNTGDFSPAHSMRSPGGRSTTTARSPGGRSPGGASSPGGGSKTGGANKPGPGGFESDARLFPPPQFHRDPSNPRAKQEEQFAKEAAEQRRKIEEANVLNVKGSLCEKDFWQIKVAMSVLVPGAQLPLANASGIVSDESRPQSSAAPHSAVQSYPSSAGGSASSLSIPFVPRLLESQMHDKRSLETQLSWWRQQGYPLLGRTTLMSAAVEGSVILPESASIGIALSPWTASFGPLAPECRQAGVGSAYSSSKRLLPPLNAFDLTLRHLAMFKVELAKQLGVEVSADDSNSVDHEQPLPLPGETLAEGVEAVMKTIKAMFPGLPGGRQRGAKQVLDPESESGESSAGESKSDLPALSQIGAVLRYEVEDNAVTYDADSLPYGSHHLFEIIVSPGFDESTMTTREIENVEDPEKVVVEPPKPTPAEGEEEPQEDEEVIAARAAAKELHLKRWAERKGVLQYAENMSLVDQKSERWLIPAFYVKRNPEVAAWIESFGSSTSRPDSANLSSSNAEPPGVEIPPMPEHFTATLGEVKESLDALIESATGGNMETLGLPESAVGIVLVKPLPANHSGCLDVLKTGFKGASFVVNDPSGTGNTLHHGEYSLTLAEGPAYALTEARNLAEKGWESALLNFGEECFSIAPSSAFGFAFAFPRSTRIWTFPSAPSESTEFGRLITRLFIQFAETLNTNPGAQAFQPGNNECLTLPEFEDALCRMDVFANTLAAYDQLTGNAEAEKAGGSDMETKSMASGKSGKSGASKGASNAGSGSDMREQVSRYSLTKDGMFKAGLPFISSLLFPYLDPEKCGHVTKKNFMYMGAHNGYASLKQCKDILTTLCEKETDVSQKWQIVSDAVWSIQVETGESQEVQTYLPMADFIERMENLPAGKVKRTRDMLEKVNQRRQDGVYPMDVNQLPFFARLWIFAETDRLRSMLFAEYGSVLRAFRAMEEFATAALERKGEGPPQVYPPGSLKKGKNKGKGGFLEVLAGAKQAASNPGSPGGDEMSETSPSRAATPKAGASPTSRNGTAATTGSKRRNQQLLEPSAADRIREWEAKVTALYPGVVNYDEFAKFVKSKFGADKFSDEALKGIFTVLDPECRGQISFAGMHLLDDYSSSLFIDQCDQLRNFLRRKYGSGKDVYNALSAGAEDVDRPTFVERMANCVNSLEFTMNPGLLFTWFDWSDIDAVVEADLMVFDHLDLEVARCLAGDSRNWERLAVLREDIARAAVVDKYADAAALKDWAPMWDRLIEEVGAAQAERRAMEQAAGTGGGAGGEMQ